MACWLRSFRENPHNVGYRFCVVRHLITCPYSNTLLSFGGIRNVITDYLVDDIFIFVFHCDDQWEDIKSESWFVIEGFEMSDVANVLVVSDEVTDCVNISVR